MNTLIAKVEGMVATILEAMDTDQGSVETISLSQEDERAADFELDTEAHHTLIEPCW